MTRRPSPALLRLSIAAQAPLGSSPDPFYRTAAWRKLRADCLERDPICRTPNCGRTSSHADHITPRRQGGADSLSNLRGLCVACHNSRSARGNGELRAMGAFADGTPRDAGHWWNADENSSGLGAKTVTGAPKKVSSASTSRRGR